MVGYTSVSVPASELTVEAYRSVREKAVTELQKAITAKGKRPEDYVIRDLQPTDLGLSTDVWSFSYASATTDTNLINITVPDDTFISIFAIANRSDSPLTTRLTFYKGTIPVKKINVEDMYVEEVKKKVLDEPLVWSESDVLRIVGYAEATGTDRLIFKGFVAEPKGKTVSVK